MAGRIYRGARLPELAGQYVFTDFCGGTIWSLTRDAAGSWTRTVLAETSTLVSSIGEGVDGELYVAGYDTGTIYALRANR